MARSRIATVALLVLVAGLAPAGAAVASQRASAPTERLAIPGLYPSFRPTVHDYVVRCGSDGGLKVGLDAVVKNGTVAVTEGQHVWERGRLELSLRADQELTVAFDSSGRVERYYVRCLPHDFPGFTFKAYARLPHVYYLVDPTTGLDGGSDYVIVFDSDGVPVWWMKSVLPFDEQAFPDHTIGWWTPAAGSSPGYVVRDLAGTVVHSWRASFKTDPHEFQLLPNGDALLSTNVARPGTVNLSAYGGPATGATLTDPVIEEVSPTSRVIWSWNAGRHLGPQDTDPVLWYTILSMTGRKLSDGRIAYDYAHLNSIQQLPDGNTLIVSFRHFSAVLAIDKRSGRILWQLGGNPSPRSLNVIGDPQGQHPFSGQHYARMLPDGTLTVYDNNTFDGYAARAVRYRINTRKMTATLIDQQRDPLATYSACCGSAAVEPGGSWLISWGFTPLITAFSPAGERQFLLEFAQPYFSYRAQELPASWLPIGQLRAGMNRIRPRNVSSRPLGTVGYTRRRPAFDAPLSPLP